MIHVNTKDFPEKLVFVLRAVLRIETRSAVPHSDVKVSVLSESQHAAIVIGVGLRDHKKGFLVHNGYIGICRYLILGDNGGAVSGPRVVEVEAWVRRVLR